MKPQDDARFIELLDRWVRGDFTRADERELHALTEADAFRQEAWEGLTGLPEANHAARLAALRARLRHVRPRGGRVVAFPQLLAAAAAVAALLIVSLFFLPKWMGETDGPVAGATSEHALPNPEMSDAAPAPPGMASTEVAPESSSPLPSPVRPGEGARAAQPPSDDVAYAEESPIEESESKLDALRDDDLAAGPSDDKAPAQAEDSGRPQPAATTPPPGAPAAATRSEAGKKAKSQPAAPANKPTDSTQWFNTEPRPDVEALREEAREQDVPIIPQPVGGWDAFSEYLRQNARLPAEARNNNVSGIVRLQFSVNANGEPYNFKTLKGLGYGCDQEAERLVQGWEWSPGRNPVVVEVRFVR